MYLYVFVKFDSTNKLSRWMGLMDCIGFKCYFCCLRCVTVVVMKVAIVC